MHAFETASSRGVLTLPSNDEWRLMGIHTLLLVKVARLPDTRDDLANETVGLAALALEVHLLVALGLAETVP